MATKALSRKILVSNRTALVSKYGVAGVKAVEKAVASLAAADAMRGLATTLVYLDRPSLGAARVRDPGDPAENKAAVDAVVRKHRPEYLVILGSHDVVPYQDLKNKLHDPADPESDPDRFAGSDLPYACEAPYSQNIAKFLGPTRVVGRLPDLTGASSPAYLIALLNASSSANGRPRPDSAFALSARVWEKSTKTSIRNILGAVPAALTSPSKGPTFTPSLLREKVHFVNCHGDLDDHTFSGEGPEDTYFTAMDARKLAGVSAGTVAAFECCYGAQLYDPQGLPAMSIANTYLAKGAAGVTASTTIAYGPADSNANADVLCQLFIEQALRGASLGRALLEARLAYVRNQSVVDPYDEKTLAQFVLLGDPSLHPFPAGAAPKTAKEHAVACAARQQRRVRLMKAGQRLSLETAFTVPARSRRRAAAALRAKALVAARRRFAHMRMFDVREPASGSVVPAARTHKGGASMPRAGRVFIATRRRKPGRAKTNAPRLEGFLAYQVNGGLVQIRLLSR